MRILTGLIMVLAAQARVVDAYGPGDSTDPSNGRVAAISQAEFNHDVRPLLSEHCWSCHGPDQNSRKSGLRLDQFSTAIQPAESGLPAIVPFQPENSELIRRVTSDDDQVRMPPPHTGSRLSAEQSDILSRWIAQGAIYQQHWSFEPLQLPDLPNTETDRSSEFSPIDAFVAEQLDQHGWKISPEAPREILLRRVALDLNGLPPSIEDLDRTDESYEQFVDRLLASPHFGERMAVDWLDAARYADTNGYFSDKPRQMWLWRDWVIDAFNRNMPFDQFTVEQVAGDLLPDSTVEQRIATGFNRNHAANNETGIIDEEFRTEYVVDRVDTTMTTWMGLTVGCAQCHDHKYDPISQREFYQLFAFFNNGPETGLIVADNPPPVMSVSTADQDRKLELLTRAATEAAARFEPMRGRLSEKLLTWESEGAVGLPRLPPSLAESHSDSVLFESFNGRLAANAHAAGTSVDFGKGIRDQTAVFDGTQHVEYALSDFNTDGPWSIGLWMMPEPETGCPISQIEPSGRRQGFEVLCQKGYVSVQLIENITNSSLSIATTTPFSPAQWHHLVISYDGSGRAGGLNVWLDGTAAAVQIRGDTLKGSCSTSQPLRIGRCREDQGYYGLLDEVHVIRRCVSDREVADWHTAERIGGVLERSVADRSEADRETLLKHFIAHYSEDSERTAFEQLQAALQDEKSFRGSIPTTLIMQEMSEPRKTHVLVRGQYDQPGEQVAPAIPAVFGGRPGDARTGDARTGDAPAGDAPMSRVGLARWLVADKNPLTARVAVNRFWIQCFGEGLVRTPGDFGSQGQPPTHPELLDWLAVTFRESGWNVKQLLKTIVMSRTYRQDSRCTDPDVRARDPQNRLLARGARFRMSAEMIRDQALAVSGLLRSGIGGPSVKPWQPPGLWEEVSYNSEDSYVPDTGDGLWRRSLYTYLKRQAPSPSFLTFDGTTREKCTVQRGRTNTPLQALVLLNDPTYVQAARYLALSAVTASTDDSVRLKNVFRQVLCRSPDTEESNRLLQMLMRQRARFSQSGAVAKTPLLAPELQNQTPASSPNDTAFAGADPIELAAWTVVTHTLLNLDEAVTRQ